MAGEPPPKRSRFVAVDDAVGWHVFSTQAAALEFLASSTSSAADASDQEGFADPPPLAVWSQELSNTGKRSYIVATCDDFWRRYKTLPTNFRHYYELIRAGRPCPLYFDLEFDRRTNPGLDGQHMVQTLLVLGSGCIQVP